MALYLNRDNNRQIFALLQLILAHPKGVTYDVLARKLRTDIITVSHYCCKLRKLRLIDWQHEKEVLVFPNSGKEEAVLTTLPPEPTFQLEESFLFHELTLSQNIWVNAASEEAISKGGLTNEEIKRKVMKHAENKMVRRTVESMKFLEKGADRQGKVFEFKYKLETEQLKKELKKVVPETESEKLVGVDVSEGEIETLLPRIQTWMEGKFPQFRGENFLLNLINNKFKDYLSILGVKQSKRQCTPLKLNRYVRVLNYLEREGGLKECELRALIVRDEAPINVGVMHKRSLLGILQGLRNIGIISEVDGIYQPCWVAPEEWVRKEPEPRPESRRTKGEDEEEMLMLPRKKVHTEQGVPKKRRNRGNNLAEQKAKYHRISEHEYRCELFTAVLIVNLQKAVLRCFRRSFNRIVYVERKKNVQQFSSQWHCLNLLERGREEPSSVFLEGEPRLLNQFYSELDAEIEERGCRQELGVEADQ